MSIKVKYRCPVENCICQVLTLENEAALNEYRSRLAPCFIHPDRMMEIVEDVDTPWVVEIANNDAIWYADIEKLPSIIAHEYWRLRELCKSNQPYAAYFQARDVIEVVLKFEVLSICAWAYSAGNETFRNEVACEITKKNISLGEWRELAQRIKKFFKENPADVPAALWRGLNKTVEEYNDDKKQLIKWRNDNIGHGALGFAEDEEFRTKLTTVIKSIYGLFYKVGQSLQEQHLKLENKELVGHGNARGLNSKQEVMMEILNSDGNSYCFSLNPYIALRGNSIFFFDNQYGPTYSELQCYTNGHRPNVSIPEFIDLYRINASRKSYVPSESRSVAANDRTIEDDFFLNIDLGDSQTVKPVMVCEWLSHQIGANSRGVYRVLMPRATGKSTLAERLNMINANPWIIDDSADVRTYHIDRTQLRGINDALHEIEDLWCEAHPGDRLRWKPDIHLTEMMLKKNLSPSNAIVAFMNEYLHSGICKKKKLVLVIDGLDEITIENKDIWNMIPTSDMLADGLHIVCLGRPSSELSGEQGQAGSYQTQLDMQSVTSELLVSCDDTSYVDFLKTYAMSQKLPEVIDLNLLLTKADNRILYLVLLCNMIKDGLTPELMGDSTSIVTKYLSVLFAKYGEKQSTYLRELLAILATLGMREPLSILEISYLLMGSSEAEISYALVGMIRDIAPLLSVSRGYVSQGEMLTGVNRYTFHDTDLALAIRQIVEDNLITAVERMICFSISMAEEGKIILNDSENACLTVFAHMKYLLGFLKDNCFQFDQENTWALICRYINTCHRFSTHVSSVRHQLLAMDYCISAFDSYLKHNNSACSIKISEDAVFSGNAALAYIYNTYAAILNENLQQQRAELYYEKAISMLKGIDGANDSVPLLQLEYDIYAGCAIVYSNNASRDPNEAIELDRLALDALKALAKKTSDFNNQHIAIHLSNIGKKYRIAGRIQESIDCYEQSLSIFSDVDPILRDDAGYATLLGNYGVALREQNQYEKAIKSYKEAIAIWETLCKEMPQQYQGKLLQPYGNIAYCYREYAKATNLDKELLLQAKMYYEKALKVLELVSDSGYLVDIHNNRGKLYGEYAIVLMLLKYTDTAKRYFKKSIDEYETVLTQGTPFNTDGFVSACVNYESILDSRRDKKELIQLQRIKQKIQKYLPEGISWQITASTAAAEAIRRMNNKYGNSTNSIYEGVSRLPVKSSSPVSQTKQIPINTDQKSVDAYVKENESWLKDQKPLGLLADGSVMFKLPEVYSRSERLFEKVRKEEYRAGSTVLLWSSLDAIEELEKIATKNGRSKSQAERTLGHCLKKIENISEQLKTLNEHRTVLELQCYRIQYMEYLLIGLELVNTAKLEILQTVDVLKLLDIFISDLHSIEVLCENRGLLAYGYSLAAKCLAIHMQVEKAEECEQLAIKYERHSRRNRDEIGQINALFSNVKTFEVMMEEEPLSKLAHAYDLLMKQVKNTVDSSAMTPCANEISIAYMLFQNITSDDENSDLDVLAVTQLLASRLINFGDSTDIDLALNLEKEILQQIEILDLLSDREIVFICVVHLYLAIAYYYKDDPKSARDCIRKVQKLMKTYKPWFDD